jgi:hypothetical protein
MWNSVFIISHSFNTLDSDSNSCADNIAIFKLIKKSELGE